MFYFFLVYYFTFFFYTFLYICILLVQLHFIVGFYIFYVCWYIRLARHVCFADHRFWILACFPFLKIKHTSSDGANVTHQVALGWTCSWAANDWTKNCSKSEFRSPIGQYCPILDSDFNPILTNDLIEDHGPKIEIGTKKGELSQSIVEGVAKDWVSLPHVSPTLKKLAVPMLLETPPTIVTISSLNNSLSSFFLPISRIDWVAVWTIYEIDARQISFHAL